MLASSEGAEDALQEALLRAWRARSNFAGRATFRTWLYRIATNACLDEMRRDRWRARRPVPADRPGVCDGADRQPEPASADPGPDALLETGEAVEGACRTIIELLPPKQRAVLILCEVLRCSSGEAAQLLGTTVGAVNSARQRARATLHGARPVSVVERRPDARLGPTERALLIATSPPSADTTSPRSWPCPADAAAQPVGSGLVVDEAVAERVCDGP